MAGYRELKVWRSAMLLGKKVYELNASFPNDERFGLTSQIRRVAVSVPSNIAEGHARNTGGDMIRFCSIALGSVAELETQLLRLSEVDEVLALTEEVGRMLHGLIRSNRT